MPDDLNLDRIAAGLRAEPRLGRIERREDALAVFLGPRPVFVAPDAAACRLAVWTVIAEVAAPSARAAAEATIAYNALGHHRTGTAASVSMELQAVLLGLSLDAAALRGPEIVEALETVERERAVVEAHLAEASRRGAAPPPDPGEAARLWA